MIAGTLRHRVTIQRATQSQNSTGEPIETWATYVTRYAAVLPLVGREYFTAQQLQAETTHKILLRGDSSTTAITPKDQILFGTRILRIESVINKNENGAEITLMCKEIL